MEEFENGRIPPPGPQNERFAAEPASGLTTLKEFPNEKLRNNASVDLAVTLKDTVTWRGTSKSKSKSKSKKQ